MSPGILAQSLDGTSDDGCPTSTLDGEGEALEVRRGMGGGSISNPRYKNVDLEPLDTGLVKVTERINM